MIGADVTALVSGPSAGIGLQIARDLASIGARLVHGRLAQLGTALLVFDAFTLPHLEQLDAGGTAANRVDDRQCLSHPALTFDDSTGCRADAAGSSNSRISRTVSTCHAGYCCGNRPLKNAMSVSRSGPVACLTSTVG